jgi:hypothetical protein
MRCLHQGKLQRNEWGELQTPSGGGKYAATGVMEIVYEEDSFTLEPDAGWELQND